ncbi:MAG: hypothetical protein U0871_03840 [Gemmataceae bacterium]
MIHIHGWQLYGKVRQVPGVAHIATVFFHLYWIPTLPLRSYVVIDGLAPEVGTTTPLGEVRQSKYGFVGIPIRMNWWSVLLAYVRAVLGFGLFTFSLGTVVFCYEAANGLGMTWANAGVFAGIAVSCGLGYWFSRWLTRAGWVSANELRADLGLPPSDEY